MTSPDSSRTTLSPLRLRLRHVAALSAAAAVALATPAPANAEDWGGLNADSSIVYFSSSYGLEPADTNSSTDLYASDGGSAALVTGGKALGAHSFRYASTDGSYVYFFTAQPLAADDSGETVDLYVRTPTGFQRITPPGAAALPVQIAGITADGTRAWLGTTAQLVPGDTDEVKDVYEYRPASKELVLLSHSTPMPANFEGGSPDGTTVWLRTAASLEPTDTDVQLDTYRLKYGSYVRMTPGNGAHHAYVLHVGATSGTLVFTTAESLVPADTDTQVDIYRRTGTGPVELVTPSNAGAASPVVTFEGADTQGGRVIFATTEPLVAADTDTDTDVYASQNGIVTLLSDGPDDGISVYVEAVSDDAQTVVLATGSQLLPSDTDGSYDLYRYSNVSKALTHINTSDNVFSPIDALVAPTSGLVAWETDEPVAAADTDGAKDIYLHVPGLGIYFVSKRSADSPPGGPVGEEMEVLAVLPDGRVLFATTERLAPTDKDDLRDVYTFAGGTLTHLSRDVSPPDTTVEAPSSIAAGQAAPVEVGSTEQGTIECRVDTGLWFDCTAGVDDIGPLAGGPHTVQARAKDVAGNVDPTPASVSIVMAGGGSVGGTGGVTGGGGGVGATDTVAPHLTDARLRLRRGAPVLSLTASEAASVRARLQRRVDGRWKTVRTVTKAGAPGTNRIKLARRVGSGKYRALVVAKDAASNTSPRLKLAMRR